MERIALISREELLGGSPGRRASTLLFAIEAHTAQLVAAARLPSPYQIAALPADRDQAFLGAMAAGRDAAAVSIQEIERHAPAWAVLLPERRDPALCAALAQLLGRKYSFAAADVPRLSAAIGLAEPEVRAAFERQFSAPIDTIFAGREPPRERLRWRWSALAGWAEGLPPFWAAFWLTLPVGPVPLILPLAFAGIGPLPGVALLVAFALVNMLTVAALAESVTRSGITRFGTGFLGQLVGDTLGGLASRALTAVMAVNNLLVLVAFYLGVADSLAGATALPAALWVAVIFAVGVSMVARRSLNTTVATILIINMVCVAAMVAIPLLALPHVRLERLAYARIPFVGGAPFDPAVLQLIAGIMLSTFFSHFLVATYGREVLRRDPSGRSLIWGSVAAIGAVLLIGCLSVAAISGAVPADTLARATGTAVAPLAALVGPVVSLLGAVIVVLGLGLATVHVSLGTFFLVQERLPIRASGPLGPRGRLVIGLAPLAGVFLAAEWLAISGSGSFARLLSFCGVIALPLLGGVFPVLLLAAARRRGDLALPGAARWRGGLPLLAGLYLLFVSMILLHGLVIFSAPLERAVTLLMGVAVLATTALVLARGALRRRAVVELRAGEAGEVAAPSVVSGGEALAAEGQVAARRANVALPATGARELKLWVHRLTPAGGSEPLAAMATIGQGGATQQVALGPPAGFVAVPFDGEPCEVGVEVRSRD